MAEYISIDQFKLMDIRVGKVVSAEIVQDADKLLRLMVDCGEPEPRQIISGIRERVADPQELVGKRLLFILNLEPRTIRGLESKGMLCAVGDDTSFAFLTPDREVPSGTKMR